MVLFGSAIPGFAAAQRGIAPEGAIFLLLPLGARIVASGQSVASVSSGADQLYWNPGATGRATRTELSVNYGKFFAGPMVSIATLFPIGRAGVIGTAISVLDYGKQEAVNRDGIITGIASQQAYVFAATYAATLGARITAGVTFKNARFIGTCSGECGDLGVFNVSSTAVDAGLQYRLLTDGDLVLAAAVRHAGLRFQVNDEEQADPLPARLQIGASYRIRQFDPDLAGGRLRVSADVIDRLLEPGAAAPRFGIDVDWNEQVGVRAGYVVGTGEGTGIGVGAGFASGNIAVDVAQTLARGGEGGNGTTFLTVRYRW